MRILSGSSIDEEELKRLLTCSDSRIALFQEFKYMPEEAVKTEVYLAILCTNGIASICLNNQTYHAEKDTFICCHPNMILERSMFSADFEFKGMVLTKEFVREFELYLEDGWNFLVAMDKCPVIRFTTKESKVFISYWNLLYQKLSGERVKHHKEVITSLLMALIYELRDSTERILSTDVGHYRSSDKLFKRFMELLTSTYPKHRDVRYYAGQLCVTPKYLSAVCKQTVGNTASDIISKYVVNDLKYLLRQHDLTIKEVATKLGFDNLSFFGKYVRRNLGISAKEYRMGRMDQDRDEVTQE